MSVDTTEIKKNLEKIRDLYVNSIDEKESSLYSKLAILELCGWIEESMDDIIRRHANKHLKSSNNLDAIKGIIRDTHGFDYKEHFRKALRQFIGLINIEKLEEQLTTSKFFDPLKAELSNLRKVRDEESHTYININIMKKYDAPSITLNRLEPIHKGLEEIDNKLNSLS